MTLAIVKLETRPHRVVAQEHWNLSDEQMKGMHVHHRIPQSQGGTNDPSNLFVCSPSFHFHAWHGANSRLNLIKQATENAKKGGLKGGLRALELGVGIHAMDHSAKARRLYGEGKALASMTPEQRSEAGRKGGTKGGKTNARNGTGVCAIPPEEHAKRMSGTNSQRWECSCCGFVSNAKTVNAHMLKEHQLDKMHKLKHHGFIK